jgi:PAS domain S-box-containing protein
MIFEDGKPEDFIYLSVNRAFETLTGLKDVTGKRVTEVIPGIREADPGLLEAYGRVSLTGKPERFETFVEALKMWFSISVYSPEKEFFVAVFDVITERKKAEEELRKSEEQFRTLADSIPNLAWWANADGYITWYNTRWYDYTGTTPKEMEGWGWQIVHDPLVLPEVLERWKASISTGEPFDMEFPLRGADGIFRPFLTRVMPMKDSAGKIIRWFGTNTDVSERKRAEEALRESEMRLKLFIEYAPASLAMFDRDMRYLSVSRRWLSDYGLGEQDLIGLCHYEVFPEIPERWKEIHRRALTGEVVREDNDRFDRADGSVQWLRWEVRPWHYASGEVAGIVVFSEDITDRKLAEDALQQSLSRFALLTVTAGD